MSKTIIFFGNERLVSGLESTDAPILTSLIQQGYKVLAVVSHHTESISRKSRSLEVATIAKSHSIPLFLPDEPIEIYDQLANLHADAAILSAYGRIVPQKIIDLFPSGIINVHPSLLPKYRGPTPIESAILNGDTKTGVSIIQLSAKMDAGPIYAQKQIVLTGTETKFDVYKQLSKEGEKLLLEILPAIFGGSLKPSPQEGEPVYCSLLEKTDGILNPQTQTATEVERQIRAYLDFPKTKLSFKEGSIIITKAHVAEEVNEKLFTVSFKNDSLLTIDELIAPSGKRMSGEAFKNGYAT